MPAPRAATGSSGSKSSRSWSAPSRSWPSRAGLGGRNCWHLRVDGKVARTATGRNNNRMALQSWDVRDLQGKQAVLEIVDAETGGWGNIGVGKVTLTDRPAQTKVLEQLPDYGTMGL